MSLFIHFSSLDRPKRETGDVESCGGNSGDGTSDRSGLFRDQSGQPDQHDQHQLHLSHHTSTIQIVIIINKNKLQ